MNIQTYKLELEFITPILGSQPTGDVATEYIAKKAGIELPEDERKTLPDVLEERTTVFYRRENGHGVEFLLYNYQVKGFLKEAGRALNGHVTGKVRNLRHKVASLVFVSPRQIPLLLPPEVEMDILERPLRGDTPLGPRVSLARSEMLDAGVRVKCGLTVYPGQITEAVLRDLLDYGYHQGIGQWRGGGFGSFIYKLVREE
jgi:hypothetical protein